MKSMTLARSRPSPSRRRPEREETEGSDLVQRSVRYKNTSDLMLRSGKWKPNSADLRGPGGRLAAGARSRARITAINSWHCAHPPPAAQLSHSTATIIAHGTAAPNF